MIISSYKKHLFHQWLLLGAFLLFSGSWIVIYIYHEHTDINKLEQERLLTQTRVVQENIESNLTSLNMSLTRLQNDRSILSFSESYNQRFKDLAEAMPGVSTLFVMDSTGTIRIANKPELIGRNLQERDYFKIPKQQLKPDVLYVSPPFKTVLGSYVINLSRCICNSEGDFLGIITAALDPHYFTALLSSVRYENDMWTYLSHGDGKLFLINPHREGIAGKVLSDKDSMLQRHITSNKADNVFAGHVHATDEQRIIALRTIQPPALKMNKPLITAASRDLAAVFSTWRKNSLVNATMFVMFGLIATISLRLYQKRLIEAMQQKASADENIRELSEELDRFFSMSLDLLCICDTDGHFRRLNRSWEETLGYSLDQLIGQQFLDFIHPDDLAATHAAMADLNSEKMVFNFVNRYLCKDGSYRWIEWRSIPYQNRLVYAVARDITELKRNQQALEELNQELIKRTAEAESVSRTKSEFLANMSHEIRTPMNAILGLTRLVLETDLTHQQKNFLRKVYRSSEALMGLLNDVLDYSKIEAGCLEIEYLPMSVREIVNDTAELFRVLIEEKGLHILIDVDPDVPAVVSGDPLRLSQVLNNLVGNAVKFTEAGEIHIKVETAKVDDDTLTLFFAVRDTGIGLCKEQSDCLFQAFTQADGTITRKYGGTGLGLAICRNLVKLMGGDIQVASTEGKGSTFTFLIQVKMMSPDTIAGLPNISPKRNYDLPMVSCTTDQAASDLEGARILLVENDKINQDIAVEFLSRRGAAVTVAGHGAEALDLIGKSSFDAVLMDIQMPVMDGLEATGRIREIYGNKTLPIIAMTSAVTQNDRQSCTAAGMVDFVAKPINPDELVIVLRKYLQLKTPVQRHECESNAETRRFPESSTRLDFVSALNRVSGNSKLLHSLLHKFVMEHGETPALLKLLLSEGKVDQALRLLHAIKGVAANLGANRLAERAAVLEKEMKSGAGSTSTFSDFDLECAVVASTITAFLHENTETGNRNDPAPVLDLEKTGVLLAELRAYLLEQELVPDDLILKLSFLAQSRQSEKTDSLFKTLLRQLDDFDHGGALETIQRFNDTCGF